MQTKSLFGTIPMTKRDRWYAVFSVAMFGCGFVAANWTPVIVSAVFGGKVDGVTVVVVGAFVAALLSFPALLLSGVLLSWFIPHELPPKRD